MVFALTGLLALALTMGCADRPPAGKRPPSAAAATVPPGSSPEARLLRNAPSYRNVPLPPQHGTHTHDRYTKEEWQALQKSVGKTTKKPDTQAPAR